VTAIGVFEADANAGKLSAEAAANNGFELEKSIDRAIFRAKERFGAYLANSQSKSDFDERWSEVKPQVIRVIAEVATPTPGVIRRVGAALRPSLPNATKKVRPSSAKTASEKQLREAADVHRDEVVPGSGVTIEPKDFSRVGSTQKFAWGYDQTTKLYTSKDPMQKFACPGCGTEQDHLGFTHCGGCDRTWNSWPVRQASSEKTSASTYVLMAREIKMRGDQFKMAAAGNVKVADAPMPQEPPPGISQPSMSGMPGDNSGAVGAPVDPSSSPCPCGMPGCPGCGAAGGPPNSPDGDNDIAGGVTEGSPIDQIQDALQDAVVALKDVQMLSINPALTTMASTKVQKVAALRTAMDRFWGLHKQLQYVAGMLAKEANEAVKAVDPRITSEAEFVQGYTAASKNLPLPAKTGKAWLEGYVAFHSQADSYSDGANIGGLFTPVAQDETAGTNDGSAYHDGAGRVDANEIRSDAGPFDSSQPASSDFASQTDADNAAGGRDHGQGESGSIQPTGARRTLPKGRK
jgi:hypothetical protein